NTLRLLPGGAWAGPGQRYVSRGIGPPTRQHNTKTKKKTPPGNLEKLISLRNFGALGVFFFLQNGGLV
ncbi:hypothetical protein ACVGW6_00430, partial [Enterobacter intestinihominis]